MELSLQGGSSRPLNRSISEVGFSSQMEYPVSQENVIRVLCPNLTCRRALAVPSDARGKLIRCRTCGMTVRVPLPKSQDGAKPSEAA